MRDLSTADVARFRRPDEELRIYGTTGNSGNGVFGVRLRGHRARAVASDGLGWDHVSVSMRDRCPTWEEMVEAKRLFFEDGERVVEYHPPASEYVDLHPFCLHLWRPNDGTELPHPPLAMV